MKLKIWELSLITALVFAVLFGAVAGNGQRALADKLVRLHVVANSDSDDDQALKLRVRDAVLEDMETLLADAGSRDNAVDIIRDNLDGIAETAGRVVSEAGRGQKVSAAITVEQFPTREYETFSLPAGSYTSLRVKIGEAGGHNWWCVVFPPLCTAAAISDTSTPAISLDGDDVSLITGETTGYVLKFRAIELWERLTAWLR